MTRLTEEQLEVVRSWKEDMEAMAEQAGMDFHTFALIDVTARLDWIIRTLREGVQARLEYPEPEPEPWQQGGEDHADG